MSEQSLFSFDSTLLVRDAQGCYLPASSDQILEAARLVVDQKMTRGSAFSSPAAVKGYLTTKLSGLDVKVFAVLFLDSQHRLVMTHWNPAQGGCGHFLRLFIWALQMSYVVSH